MKILQIREKSTLKFDGIDVNCKSLCDLFDNHININMLNLEDYETYTIPLLNRRIITQRSLVKSIVSSDPDVIHVHGFAAFSSPRAIRLAKKYGKRIVFSPHFHPFSTLRNPFLGKLFFTIVLKWTLKYVETVITLNNEDTLFFRKFHNNVIRVPHFLKSGISSVISDLPKRNNMILFVGRIEESNKGIEHLYYLPKNTYEVHCVGRGNLKRKDFIQHTDISNEELNNLLIQASLLVVPSRYESFSYVALEALSVGTPVVISDRVRIADYLDDFIGVGKFKYSDYSDFIEVVAQTINSKVNTVKIMSLFDMNLIRNEYENIYLNAKN